MKFLALFVLLAVSWSVSVDAAKALIKTPAQVACGFVKEGTYIADPANCKKFFKCEKGVPISGTCSSTTSYSVVDNACILTKNAICVKDFQNIVCRNKKDNEKVADPENCKNYYTCSKKKTTSDKSTACEKKTPSFNPELQQCVTAASYECPPDNHCTLIADQIFTSHSNSKKCWAYFLCMNNNAIAGECRDGFGYHQSQGVCDYGYVCPKVECDSSKDTPIPDTCSEYHSCKSIEINDASTCPLKQHFDADLGKCVSAWLVAKPCKLDRCENMPDGFYVAVEGTECRKFYYCLKGKMNSSNASSCPADYPYLNEEYQQCVKVQPSFPICKS